MRRRGRECALQILYQMDLNKDLTAGLPDESITRAIHDYWSSFEAVVDEEREFAERLVRGVVAD